MRLSALGLLISLAMAAPKVAFADAVVVTRAMKASTIAEIFVDEGSIKVELEIGETQLGAFSKVVDASTRAEELPTPIPASAELSVLTDGRRLSGVIEEVARRKRVERDEISGEPLPSEAAEEVVFLVLSYPLRGHPKTLVINPPMKGGYASGDVGFVLYHHGIPVNDFRYLSTNERVLLDWDDPFYSRFERRQMNRKFNAPMNVFLYVEPFEVRKELVLRPLDLARFTALDIAPHEPIPAEQRAAFLNDVAAFLSSRAEVTIDGERPEPILDRIHFLKRGLRMTRVLTPDEPVNGTDAIIGAIFVYPVDGMPKDVRLDWDMFDSRIARVPAAATDEAGPMPSFLTPDDSQLHWVNYLKRSSLPGELDVQAPVSHLAISVVFAAALLLAIVFALLAWRRRSWSMGLVAFALIAAGYVVPSPSIEVPVSSSVRQPTGIEAAPTIHALLYNVYRALDFRDEEVVFDRLAQSLSGDVLERVYLEMRSGLRLENQGGARVRVRQVKLLDVTPEEAAEPGALRYRTKWHATGSVGHWGHTHMRTNAYDAEITLAPSQDRWRIADIQILEEQRLSAGQR